jgi:hypothetical protein
MHNFITKREKESLKYLYRWTPNMDRALQKKEMKEIMLNNNKKLHSRNIFKEIFVHLKAPSLGALVFKRA